MLAYDLRPCVMAAGPFHKRALHMDDLFKTLRSSGQDHLIPVIESLPQERQGPFVERLRAIDWQELAAPEVPLDDAAVAQSRVVDRQERAQRADEFSAVGERAYQDGAVAVLMVAGGQGTRLGLDAPKGCFPIGALSGASIYQLQAEKVLALSRRIGRAVPLLVMTSPMTDAQTRSFFAEHQRFGLAEDQLRFFCQGTVPSLDADGRALLAAPDRLLENPDGHGGCFTALVASGQLQRLVDEGVRRIVYIQVDNILVPVDDPILVGVAEVESADVVTKVLDKAHPDEKVGHLVRVGERDRIIEYTELTAEQARMRDDDGRLVYRWGSPAMHCWSVSFLAALAQDGFRPPLHRSAKPLKAWREGAMATVEGWKNERFIFDLIPQARISIGLEIERDDEFAPVKNADSQGSDCPATARRLASDLFARWLSAQGVVVDLPPDAHLEISPVFAATVADLAQRWDGRSQRVDGDLLLR